MQQEIEAIFLAKHNQPPTMLEQQKRRSLTAAATGQPTLQMLALDDEGNTRLLERADISSPTNASRIRYSPERNPVIALAVAVIAGAQHWSVIT